MSTLAPHASSAYLTLASLRAAGFAEPRVQAAIFALFPDRDDDPAYSDGDFEELDDAFQRGEEPAEPDELADDFVLPCDEPAFEPSESDWAEYAAIFDRIDRRPIAVMTRVPFLSDDVERCRNGAVD